MAELTPDRFAEFFEAVHDYRPFPWQRMLLEKIAAGADWPQVIDLPTASGKTACIDIAVFALALQAVTSPQSRTAPRRIFFAVDRRIVVDEAFDRAAKLAGKLAEATNGILKDTADRLRQVSGGESPLAVSRLRGGIARTQQHWSENPLQAAVITSTVDQLGSRLLFRSYGGSPLMAPIHAALTAYDSLIILDEAHCARPFMQTVASVRDYLDSEKWSSGKVRIAMPLKLVVMSATAPLEDAAGNELAKFPNEQERNAALSDSELTKRSAAVKLARMELIGKNGTNAFAERALSAVAGAIKTGCKRAAVMVNRVGLAHEIAGLAKVEKEFSSCDVVLLTGRMRPIDRDELLSRWSRFLRASAPDVPGKPIVLVTTQCLEVGADFGFDFLVTQCASIDALLQRFGRLDRFGNLGGTNALILAAKSDVAADNDDPIYGKGITKTWNWLQEAAKNGPDPATVNFAINSLGENFRNLEPGVRDGMLAPHPDAPVLMPAHVDILCQTAPHPTPDIDVPAYLHGVGRGQAEVRVAFRVDLAAEGGGPATGYSELLALCPPKKQECLSVPIFRLKKYLLGQTPPPAAADDEDVEGAAVAGESQPETGSIQVKQYLRFRDGEWESLAASKALNLIRPNDLIVLPMRPVHKIPAELGTSLDDAPVDRAEEAAWLALPQRNRRGFSGIFLRISPSVLQQEPLRKAAQPLLDWLGENGTDADADVPDIDSLRAQLRAAAKNGAAAGEKSRLADFGKICDAMAGAIRPKYLKPHPIEKGSWIISVPGQVVDIDESAADEDAASASDRPVYLSEHLADVQSAAEKFAQGLPEDLREVLDIAGRWHDLGKLDPRFQDLLGNLGSDPLAKSDNTFTGRPDFRHEMVSLQIVQKCLAGLLPTSEIRRELLLHLIAAHHGHARPFAPVRIDLEPGNIVAPNGFDPPVHLTAESRAALPKAQHLGSGIADRFWFLTRSFGWWGLAYMESVLRLADWEASANPHTQIAANAEASQEVCS